MNFGQFPGLLSRNKMLLLRHSQKLAKDEIMSLYFTAVRAVGRLASFYSVYDSPGPLPILSHLILRQVPQCHPLFQVEKLEFKSRAQGHGATKWQVEPRAGGHRTSLLQHHAHFPGIKSAFAILAALQHVISTLTPNNLHYCTVYAFAVLLTTTVTFILVSLQS